MALTDTDDLLSDPPRRKPWVARIVVSVLVLVAIVLVYMTNSILTQRFSETTRNRAELRLALYSGNVMSELQRNSVVPLLLARDPALIEALTTTDFTSTSQRLMSLQTEIGAASILLLDSDGRVVGSTDRNRIGANLRASASFVEAQRSKDSVFTVNRRDGGGYEFTYSRNVTTNNASIGVVVVEVDLNKFEKSWAGFSDAVIASDTEGYVILSTEPRWRGLTLKEALAVRDAPSAIERAWNVTADWTQARPDAYLRGMAVMKNSTPIPFHGWTLTSFTRYDSIRDQVNGVLALEIMGFAILLALTFYILSRRALSQSALFQRESAELRQLNARLQREVAERERVQKDLAVAEQTLAQSSKLAALGEMAAAVSHELNQPLAAMKTYLAGARLLLQRKRPEEALSSFQRIDDLIERMGAVALSMMEPQLKTRAVKITRTLPRTPVMVMADRIRLEQVIINLLRNALDATKGEADAKIDIFLSAGETATLSVRDNGHGIANLDALFEPFYTTKRPGEGVGLGLAISSGIVKDLGGRLTAHNGDGGGAVFEVQLPILQKDVEAAE